jgi:hypothetical protein
VTIQEPTQVTSCCNLLAPVRQLPSNSRSVRMSFLQVRRMFIVEQCLASRSYLTCRNEFRDAFPDPPVPNKSTVSRLVNRFRDTGLFTGLHQTWGKEWMLKGMDISNTYITFFFWFQCNFFLDKQHVRNRLRDFSITLYVKSERHILREPC